jgi:hypothetical protein
MELVFTYLDNVTINTIKDWYIIFMFVLIIKYFSLFYSITMFKIYKSITNIHYERVSEF